jgi:hypothetical protein
MARLEEVHRLIRQAAGLIEATTGLPTGSEIKVLVRRGSWPPDMYRKGVLAKVLQGGKVGDEVKIKEKGEVMSSGQTFRLAANKDGTFQLIGDPRFKRALKVKVA